MSGPFYAVLYLYKDELHSQYDVVYRKDDITIHESQSRLYMVKQGYNVAELISGRCGLKRYHKDSFDVWIGKVKKKDLAKAQKMRKDSDKILSQADEIETLWSDQIC